MSAGKEIPNTPSITVNGVDVDDTDASTEDLATLSRSKTPPAVESAALTRPDSLLIPGSIGGSTHSLPAQLMPRIDPVQLQHQSYFDWWLRHQMWLSSAILYSQQQRAGSAQPPNAQPAGHSPQPTHQHRPRLYSAEPYPKGQRSRSESDIAYCCTYCGQSFALHDRLAKHIASRHRDRSTSNESPMKSHKCTVCGKSFGRSDMLTRHMRLHTGVKPYACRACGQVFSRSDHLSTHQRTHTGEKPYACPQCSYAASRRDMITRHMRTHLKAMGGGPKSPLEVDTGQPHHHPQFLTPPIEQPRASSKRLELLDPGGPCSWGSRPGSAASNYLQLPLASPDSYSSPIGSAHSSGLPSPILGGDRMGIPIVKVERPSPTPDIQQIVGSVSGIRVSDEENMS